MNFGAGSDALIRKICGGIHDHPSAVSGCRIDRSVRGASANGWRGACTLQRLGSIGTIKSIIINPSHARLFATANVAFRWLSCFASVPEVMDSLRAPE
jgi:hypothetical protein